MSRQAVVIRYSTSWQGLVPIALAAAWLAGCKVIPNSNVQDIYVEDRGDGATGNERRRPATNDERLWTIDMGGCTGHLIAPDYMMTASHCQYGPSNPVGFRKGARFRSGASIVKGGDKDITVTEIVENGFDRNSRLDYAILKISWNGARPGEQNFPPLIATKSSDVSVSRSKDQGDELFTVGFPGDVAGRWGATFSQGFAKAIDQGPPQTPMAGRLFLYYNIGTINGNSGGGVWRKKDKMLVSLVNAGLHAIGQPGWNTGSADNPSHWNLGELMWVIYAQSKTLQDIFPGGKNRFSQSSTAPDSDKVWALLGNQISGFENAYELIVSVPKEAKKVSICTTAKAEDCKESASGYVTTSMQRTIGNQGIFKADRGYSLSDNTQLHVVALDENNKLIASRQLLFQKK